MLVSYSPPLLTRCMNACIYLMLMIFLSSLVFLLLFQSKEIIFQLQEDLMKLLNELYTVSGTNCFSSETKVDSVSLKAGCQQVFEKSYKINSTQGLKGKLRFRFIFGFKTC